MGCCISNESWRSVVMQLRLLCRSLCVVMCAVLFLVLTCDLVWLRRLLLQHLCCGVTLIYTVKLFYGAFNCPWFFPC